MIETIIAVAVIVLILFLIFKIFKLITRLVLVALFLLVAYITNPGIEKHRAAVTRKAESTHASMRGKQVKVNDLKIFSLTNIAEGEDDKLVGAGLFTKVWIFGNP